MYKIFLFLKNCFKFVTKTQPTQPTQPTQIQQIETSTISVSGSSTIRHRGYNYYQNIWIEELGEFVNLEGK